MGHFLRSAGQTSSLQDANGLFEYELNWLEGLKNPNLETLAGHIDIHLKNGQILGVEPGIGRVLGLLSLSNIQRRLTFNFSDLTKQGFAFDTINSHVGLDKGQAQIDNLSLQGPIANMDFSGWIGLQSPQSIQGEMRLKPNIAASLPLAATIASGNPAIGAAFWVFNRTLGRDIEEIVRYRYAISGTLEAPQIEELEIIREKPKTP